MDTLEDSSKLSIQQNADREYFQSRLTAGYANNEPLGRFVTEMIEREIDPATRTRLILQSDYAKDEKIKSALLLFGAR